MAETAPMPRASVTSAAAVKPGLRPSPRTPVRRSRRSASNMPPLTEERAPELLSSSDGVRDRSPDLRHRLRADDPPVSHPPDHEDGGAAEHHRDGPRSR